MIKREWYNLADAAARIGGTEADVLHLAATVGLRLCFLLTEGTRADRRLYDQKNRTLYKTDSVDGLHGFVGLTALCAGDLEIHGQTKAQFFHDLKAPGYEWWLRKTDGIDDQPTITIHASEVVVMAADLLTLQTTEAHGRAERDRAHISDRLAKLNQAAGSR